jgi:membrane-associated HD superfamily phosphohydrolase
VTVNVILVMKTMFVTFVLVSELTHQLVIVQWVCIHHQLLILITNSVLIKLVPMMELVLNVLTNVRLVMNSSLVTPVLITVSDFPHQNVYVKMDTITKKVTNIVDLVKTNV